MPALEKGDLDTLRKQATRNLDVLVPFVEQGARVVAINPTCAMMLRREYPSLVAAPDRDRARAVLSAGAAADARAGRPNPARRQPRVQGSPRDEANGHRATAANDSREGLRLADELTPENGLICLCGSLYLVGEVYSLLSQ